MDSPCSKRAAGESVSLKWECGVDSSCSTAQHACLKQLSHAGEAAAKDRSDYSLT